MVSAVDLAEAGHAAADLQHRDLQAAAGLSGGWLMAWKKASLLAFETRLAWVSFDMLAVVNRGSINGVYLRPK